VWGVVAVESEDAVSPLGERGGRSASDGAEPDDRDVVDL